MSEVTQNQPAATEETEKKEETKVMTLEELAKLTKEAEERAMEKYKGIQRVVSKFDQENKKLKEQLERLQSTDYTTLLDLAEKQARDNSDAEGLEKIATLRSAEAKKKQQMTLELQMAKQQEIIDTKREEIETKIRESGGDPEDPKFDTVWDAWEIAGAKDGDFSRADKRLEKLIGKKAAPAQKVDEKVLRPEGITPSGGIGAFTAGQIAQMSDEEFRKNYAAISEAYRTGRIRK